MAECLSIFFAQPVTDAYRNLEGLGLFYEKGGPPVDFFFFWGGGGLRKRKNLQISDVERLASLCLVSIAVNDIWLLDFDLFSCFFILVVTLLS